MKKELESAAATALVEGSTWALVGMAFFAVLREGFETSVFLLAAFQASREAFAAGVGALLGIVVAAAIGYGIYRGGIRINLARFFRVTGLILVLVAAGLVATTLHTAHEVGWLNVGQATAADLSWLLQPESVLGALVTGVLGLQPRPAVIELLGWAAYLVPIGLYVAWPTPRRPAPVIAQAES